MSLYSHFYRLWTYISDKERIYNHIFCSLFCVTTRLPLRLVVHSSSVAVWNEVWSATSLMFSLQILWTEQLHVQTLQNSLQSVIMKLKQHERKSNRQKLWKVSETSIYEQHSHLCLIFWPGLPALTFWLYLSHLLAINILGDSWTVSEPYLLPLAPMSGRSMIPFTLLQYWGSWLTILVEQADITVPTHKAHAIMRKLSSWLVAVPVSIQMSILYYRWCSIMRDNLHRLDLNSELYIHFASWDLMAWFYFPSCRLALVGFFFPSTWNIDFWLKAGTKTLDSFMYLKLHQKNITLVINI